MTSPSPCSSLGAKQREASEDRVVSNARLASPVPALGPRAAHSSDPQSIAPGASDPLPTSLSQSDYPKQSQEHSGLATALDQQHATNPSLRDNTSSITQQLPPDQRQQNSAYGSFRDDVVQTRFGSPRTFEDFDIVRRHLAGPSDTPSRDEAEATPELGMSVRSGIRDDRDKSSTEDRSSAADNTDDFSSLRMLGGDITREIYRRTEAEAARKRVTLSRSRSLVVPRHDADHKSTDYSSIHQPGGFRREHLRRNAASPKPRYGRHANQQADEPAESQYFMTRNFFEFLSLYGHFAGESADDDDDDEEEEEHESGYTDSPGDESDGEQRPLIARQNTKPHCKKDASQLKTGAAGTMAILTKSFVGTGVLFLPRAFLNGGMLFSFLVLIGVSMMSYYCFLLLTTSRTHLRGSFAQMGEMTYGQPLRRLINISLVVSQIGFASAYIVFTSENLRAFVMAVSNCETIIDMKYMILMQLIIFLPLSLYRNLNSISFIVYIADAFIVLGLIYLYYYGIATLVDQGGISDIILFNKDSWTLFIGTAIFTFEGVGLIIPIQDGMKKPQQLPLILGGVMILITIIFVSMGALSYAAYGSKTETVIILNMNQKNEFVNALQFLYSLAILLSTPMQLYPAITISEHSIFTKSGKHSKFVKWRKNLFRFGVVMLATFIAWIGANDLDKFVALVGSFACIPLVYIYPPLIHSRAVAGRWWERLIDFALCLIGLILMVYTTALTIDSWANETTAKKKPGYCDGVGIGTV